MRCFFYKKASFLTIIDNKKFLQIYTNVDGERIIVYFYREFHTKLIIIYGFYFWDGIFFIPAFFQQVNMAHIQGNKRFQVLYAFLPDKNYNPCSRFLIVCKKIFEFINAVSPIIFQVYFEFIMISAIKNTHFMMFVFVFAVLILQISYR